MRKIVRPLAGWARRGAPIVQGWFHREKKSHLTLMDEMHSLAESMPPSASQEDYSECALKYVELTEESFLQFASRSEADPQMMLMMLSTFQSPRKVAEFLPALYPSINRLEKGEMLLLLEKILAYRPVSKPRIPHPKSLEQIESVLVILSELYSCDSLIEWIKYVPVYQGSSGYVLAMGYFSILQKMSQQAKNRNRAVLIRCHQRLEQMLTDDFTTKEEKVGIVSLALEMNYGQALPLFFVIQIDYSHLDPHKICLLYTNLSRHLAAEKERPAELRSVERERSAEHEIKEMMKVMEEQDFQQLLKVEVMMDLWRAFLSQKELKGTSLTLVDRVSRVCVDKNYSRSMGELNAEELITILECMAKHKINKQKLLKTVLVFLSEHLHSMEKRQLIRLLRCLVVYVRQCEEYLIDVRKVLELRRLEFSQTEAGEINEVLKRVSILFPKPFVAGCGE